MADVKARATLDSSGFQAGVGKMKGEVKGFSSQLGSMKGLMPAHFPLVRLSGSHEVLRIWAMKSTTTHCKQEHQSKGIKHWCGYGNMHMGMRRDWLKYYQNYQRPRPERAGKNPCRKHSMIWG